MIGGHEAEQSDGGRLYSANRRPLERTQRTKGANLCHTLRFLHQSQRNARGLSAVEIRQNYLLLNARAARAYAFARRAPNNQSSRAGCQKSGKTPPQLRPRHKPAKTSTAPPPPEPASLRTMAAGDAGAFVLNIISSVFIISVNKRLMGSPPNFNFRYVVTLNALHYITTSIWTRVAKVIGLAKQEESSKAPAHVPLSSVVLFTTVIERVDH